MVGQPRPSERFGPEWAATRTDNVTGVVIDTSALAPIIVEKNQDVLETT